LLQPIRCLLGVARAFQVTGNLRPLESRRLQQLSVRRHLRRCRARERVTGAGCRWIDQFARGRVCADLGDQASRLIRDASTRCANLPLGHTPCAQPANERHTDTQNRSQY
jgi:hypothetical protein